MAAPSRPAGPPGGSRSATAEDVVAVVRVHLDRVHDAVRRLGCAPEDAVEVVETSALELVEAAGSGPAAEDPVGWWFARARRHGRQVATRASAPLGGGLLSADEGQQRLSEALEELPEQERLALLLRDSYALPAASVGAALGLDADDAMAVVAQARLDLLPLVDDRPAPAVAPHGHELAALGRLGEAGPPAARDATARRHVLSCPSCEAVVDAQQRAHLRLAGLTVVALPEDARGRVLSRVHRSARRLLPATAAVPDAGPPDEGEPAPPPLFSPLLVLLSLLLAALAGLGIGLVLVDRDGSAPVADLNGELPADLPLVSPPAPLPTSSPVPVPEVEQIEPRTTVFVVPPPPSPSPPPAPPSPPPAPPSPSPSPTPAPTIALSNDDGPDGTQVTVTGSGFSPGAEVTVDYRDASGEPAGAPAVTTADDDGDFSVELAAQGDADEPGPREVVATDGEQIARATFPVQE